MNHPLKHTISFENTQYAFEYKTNAELKKAHFLFSLMGNPLLISLGLRIMQWAIKLNLPLIKSIIKKTIFEQFVGGETLEQTKWVVSKLADYQVKVILDYGVEGKENEQAFQSATTEFLKAIEYASSQKNIPFISIKISGISRFSLLEKIDHNMSIHKDFPLLERYQAAIRLLDEEEKKEWQLVYERLHQLCSLANEKNIALLIDAEESWIQEPVDGLATIMMIAFNIKKCVVYNTFQLYRHDRLKFLQSNFSITENNQVILGAKLVRGAYMEKERLRAAKNGYPSPIQPSKESTDQDYNTAIEFVINHLDKVAVIIASHNEYSNLYATQLMSKNNIPANHPHMHFSQLYGMSDNITFNLAKFGCSVSKYLPFGPIKDVVPYLIRRAQENSSVAGQTGRELSLIKTELQRRK